MMRAMLCAFAFATFTFANPAAAQDPMSCTSDDCSTKTNSLLQKTNVQIKRTVDFTDNGDVQDEFAQQVLLQILQSQQRRETRLKLMSDINFKQLDSRHFLARDASKDCHSNAEAAFNHLLSSSGIDSKMSPSERNVFHQHFDEHVEYYCNDHEQSHDEWISTLAEAAQDEACVVTESEAVAFNAGPSSFAISAHNLRETCMPAREFRELLGKKPIDASFEQQHAHIKTKKRKLESSTAPQSFQSQNRWTECQDVITRAHNQGHCGSCWAFAGTFVLDSRICIMTGGAFQGQLSRTVVTSCAFAGDGCQGGMEYNAWRYSANNAVPSGGEDGCVPYFSSGEGTQHFAVQNTQPACPNQCVKAGTSWDHMDFQTQGSDQDFFSWSMPMTADLKSELQTELMTNGPVANGVNADSLFMGYTSGVFDDCNGHGPNHAVVILGWGQDNADLYWTLMNSWGPHWGRNGMMDVASCVITDFSYPGDFSQAMGGWDISLVPTPPTPFPTPAPTPPTPVPTPAPPTPAPPLQIVVDSGDCGNDDAKLCAMSPNYPSKYSSNQGCSLTITGDASGPLEIKDFQTESKYDKLFVNGAVFSGRRRPNGVEAKGSITWTSDGSEEKRGWKICLPGPTASPTPLPTPDPTPFPTPAPTPPTPAPTPSPPTPAPLLEFVVESGDCGYDDATLCAWSPNYPLKYGEREFCSLSIKGDVSVPLQVVAFDTEYKYDKLIVNGEKFSGTTGPSGAVASGSITWTSDYSMTRTGWKICLASYSRYAYTYYN